jgi:hypothetical protein
MFRFLTQSKKRVGGAKTDVLIVHPPRPAGALDQRPGQRHRCARRMGSVMQEVARRKAKKQEADRAA